MNLPYEECLYYTKARTTEKEKRSILLALSGIYAGIFMLIGLTITAANSWLGYTKNKENNDVCNGSNIQKLQAFSQ